jgi:hypothetical protein
MSEVLVHRNFLHGVRSSDRFNYCEEFFRNFQASLRFFQFSVGGKVVAILLPDNIHCLDKSYPEWMRDSNKICMSVR